MLNLDLNKVFCQIGRSPRVCSFADLAPLPKKERPPAPVRKKTFTEYWMTGDEMLKIVALKHKESQKEDDRKTREKACMKTALTKFRQIERKKNAKKALPKKIKTNPKL